VLKNASVRKHLDGSYSSIVTGKGFIVNPRLAYGTVHEKKVGISLMPLQSTQKTCSLLQFEKGKHPSQPKPGASLRVETDAACPENPATPIYSTPKGRKIPMSVLCHVVMESWIRREWGFCG
jgi:hypothetical protein